MRLAMIYRNTKGSTVFCCFPDISNSSAIKNILFLISRINRNISSNDARVFCQCLWSALYQCPCVLMARYRVIVHLPAILQINITDHSAHCNGNRE